MATPTLVQSVMTGQDTVGALGKASLRVPFPNPTLANNFIVLAFQHDDRMNVTSVKDNFGNALTAGPTFDNTTTFDAGKLYYLPNCSAGLAYVEVLFDAAFTFLQGHLSEWYNVKTSSPGDGSIGTASDVTSPYNAGSFSTTVDGDLIVSYGFGFGGGSGTLTGITAGTAGSGFSLMGADIQSGGNPNGAVAQYQVQVTHGAINADFTTTGNTTATYGMVVMAFQSASAGTAPTLTPRVVAVHHQYLGPTPSTHLQFPCPTSCNTLIGMMNDDNLFITALTDSASNTWSFPASGKADNSVNATTAQLIYAANATCSPTLGSLNITYNTTTTGNPFIVLYAVTGLHQTAPFDNAENKVGNTITLTPVTGAGVTPSTVGGMIFANLAVTWHDVLTVTAAGYQVIFDSVLDAAIDNDPPDGGTGTSPLDEDNGNAHINNASLSRAVFVWATTQTGATNPGFGQWASIAGAFRAPVSPASGGNQAMDLAVNQRRDDYF